MTKYLVTGATGQLGRVVIDHLVKLVPAGDVVALVRKQGDGESFAKLGAEVRIGDYEDPASLREALSGIDRVLLISSPALGQRVPQHKALIDAAVANGVGFIAYTSLLGGAANPMQIAGEHIATEALIAESGITATILRNPWYTENFLMQIQSGLAGGQIFGASGEGRFSPATRADLGEATAKVLVGGHDGKVIDLAGDDSFTMAQFVETLNALTGKSVAFVNLPEPAFAGGLMQVGIPEPIAKILADADAQAANDYLYSTDRSLSGLLGRPTASYVDVLKGALAAAPAA